MLYRPFGRKNFLITQAEVTSVINNIGRPNRSYYTGGSSIYTNPPAPDMSTKGQCRTREDRLIAKIKALAYKDAAAGKDLAHKQIAGAAF